MLIDSSKSSASSERASQRAGAAREQVPITATGDPKDVSLPANHHLRQTGHATKNPMSLLRSSPSGVRQFGLDRVWEHGFEAGTLARYSFAIVLACGVSALRILFNRIWGEEYPFLFYFPVTLFTGLYGGIGPALVSIGITAAATFLWVFLPIGQLPTFSPKMVQGLAAYIVVDMMIAWIGSRHRQVLDERRQAARAKDAFLASVSHELRTPLTPVLMTTSILQNDRTLSPGIRTALNVISRNVELQAKMVNDLLDLSRVINRKLDLDLAECDLHEIIERALVVCMPAANAKQSKLTTRLEASRSRTHGDATRLQQLFWNLIQNAIKFTPADGSITIHSRDLNGEVQIDISDTGCGIEPAKLQTIFEPFEQADSRLHLQDGRRGLGIGLAIARQIAVAHGGMLTAASEGLNRGSTFTVFLPATSLPSS